MRQSNPNNDDDDDDSNNNKNKNFLNERQTDATMELSKCIYHAGKKGAAVEIHMTYKLYAFLSAHNFTRMYVYSFNYTGFKKKVPNWCCSSNNCGDGGDGGEGGCGSGFMILLIYLP